MHKTKSDGGKMHNAETVTEPPVHVKPPLVGLAVGESVGEDVGFSETGK